MSASVWRDLRSVLGPKLGKDFAPIQHVLQRPDIVSSYKNQGVELVMQTPEQFFDFIKLEIQRYRKIILSSGVPTK